MTSLTKFNTKTKANKGVEIELKDLSTGRGSGAFVTVYGSDGDVFRDLQSKRGRDVMEMIKTRGKEYVPTVDESDRSTCEMLASCTIGWRDLEDEGGEPLVFSYDNAVKLYLDYPRVRDQINIAIADAQNFLAG